MDGGSLAFELVPDTPPLAARVLSRFAALAPVVGDRLPVTYHQPMLAAACRTGPNLLRRSGISTVPDHKSAQPGGQRLATGLGSPHLQSRAKGQTAR